jgi:hypothetical protein
VTAYAFLRLKVKTMSKVEIAEHRDIAVSPQRALAYPGTLVMVALSLMDGDFYADSTTSSLPRVKYSDPPKTRPPCRFMSASSQHIS